MAGNSFRHKVTFDTLYLCACNNSPMRLIFMVLAAAYRHFKIVGGGAIALDRFLAADKQKIVVFDAKVKFKKKKSRN